MNRILPVKLSCSLQVVGQFMLCNGLRRVSFTMCKDVLPMVGETGNYINMLLSQFTAAFTNNYLYLNW